MTGNSNIQSSVAADFAHSQSAHDRRLFLSRRVLWEMLLFLVVSLCAYAIKDISLFELASEPVRQILGYPPPAWTVSIALAVYCFSAVSLTLTAIARGNVEPEQKWNQLGYRSAFYLFYSFSGSINENFVVVLGIGLLLYVLDLCHVRGYGIWLQKENCLAEKE